VMNKELEADDFYIKLRTNKFKITWSKVLFEYRLRYYTNDQLLQYIIELDCSDSELKYIPEIPKCKKIICSNNQLTNLPKLESCEICVCDRNLLTKLPSLEKCRLLFCEHNNIILIPDTLHQCSYIFCAFNCIDVLPEILFCQVFSCEYNYIKEMCPLPCCEICICDNNMFDHINIEYNMIFLYCDINVKMDNDQLTSCESLDEQIHINIITCKLRFKHDSYVEVKHRHKKWTLLLEKKDNKIYEMRKIII
jgi:Leucine-rich repeat (LRR) protein